MCLGRRKGVAGLWDERRVQLRNFEWKGGKKKVGRETSKGGRRRRTDSTLGQGVKVLLEEEGVVSPYRLSKGGEKENTLRDNDLKKRGVFPKPKIRGIIETKACEMGGMSGGGGIKRYFDFFANVGKSLRDRRAWDVVR